MWLVNQLQKKKKGIQKSSESTGGCSSAYFEDLDWLPQGEGGGVGECEYRWRIHLYIQDMTMVCGEGGRGNARKEG